jgi:RNA polymerase sigma-70 factor (ECF subfamily)
MTGTAQSAVCHEITAAVSASGPALYERSRAALFSIPHDEFAGWLLAIAHKYLPAGVTEKQAEDLLGTLRIEDLVLARACAAGHERAWEQFMARFRELLYDSALGIAREASQAKDLADSLYAELYGMNERSGQRVSKLSSYTGRGSLEGWLRTVVAQEFVNRYRTTKRLVSLEEEEEDGSQFAAPEPPQVSTADARVDDAVSSALSALDSESRTILAAYYLDGRKLAEIGRMLGFHEATASRKLDRITKALRKAIRDGLLNQGMSKRQVEEALEADVRDLNVNVQNALAQEKAAQSFKKENSTRLNN